MQENSADLSPLRSLGVGWGWGGLLSLRSHSLSGGLDVPVAMASTGSRKQQGELSPGRGDRRSSGGFQPCFLADHVVFIQAPKPGDTRNDEPWEEMEPVADQEVRTSQSWKVPRKRSACLCSGGLRLRARAGKTQHLGEGAGISGRV